MHKNKSAEEFLKNAGAWTKELTFLRSLILKLNVLETIKWGVPVYTDSQNKNIVGLAGFKSYVGIWFYQGVFLEDSKNYLINAQEGVTKGLRQWRFSSLEEIIELQHTITTYIEEAIENQKQGKEVKISREKTIDIPELLQSSLDENDELSEKFEAFTFGKKKEFSQYINEAKREETKKKRLEKIIPMILSGIGLNDKYRK